MYVSLWLASLQALYAHTSPAAPLAAATVELTDVDAHGIMVWANTLYAAGGLDGTASVGVNILGAAGGDPPTTIAVAVTSQITQNTLYGSAASPVAFAFQGVGAGGASVTVPLLWICDGGGAATQGVWQFSWNVEDLLYLPRVPADHGERGGGGGG